MTASGDLYRITVAGAGEGLDWGDSTHVPVEMMLAFDPATEHDHTPEEVLAAYRWAAGVMARVACSVAQSLLSFAQQQKHGCLDHRYEDGEFCGNLYVRLVEYPVSALGDLEQLCMELLVPIEHLNLWVDRTRRVLAQVLADDQKPAPPWAAGTLTVNHGYAVPAEQHTTHHGADTKP